jgi:DNA-binding winged helix-turn-helix (wHTH) protein
MTKETKAFEFGPFRLEVLERRLTRDGHSVPLRGRVFDTLLSLVSRHGCLVTKDELMAAVWPDSVVEETNLNHNICVLRRALGEKATGQKYVETVPRQGYRFVAAVRELDELDESSPSRSWDIQDSTPVALENGSDLQPPPLESPARTRWFKRRGILAFAFIAAFLIVGYNGVERLGLMGNRSQSRVMLAVLPFENLTGRPKP